MRGTLLVALAVPAAAIVYNGVDYPWISNRSCSDDPDDCPGAGRCTQLPDYAGGNGSSGLFCRCGWFGQMKAPECQEPTPGTSNPFATYTTTAVVYGLVVLDNTFLLSARHDRHLVLVLINLALLRRLGRLVLYQ